MKGKIKKIVLYLFNIMLLFSIFSSGIIIYGQIVGDKAKESIFSFFGLIFATFLFYIVLKIKGWK